MNRRLVLGLAIIATVIFGAGCQRVGESVDSNGLADLRVVEDAERGVVCYIAYNAENGNSISCLELSR